MRLAWITVVIAWAAPVAAAPDVTSIAASTSFTCAALADGSVWCWGYNHTGQLGDGSTIDRSVPVRVLGIDDAIQVATSDSRACALHRDATVSCWGVIAPPTVTRAAAIPVTDVVQISGSCMRTVAGNVACVSSMGKVVPVTDLADAVDIAGGELAGCAVRGNGTVACWMTTDYAAQPVAKLSGGATRVAVAGMQACALVTANGLAVCWDWGMGPRALEPRMRRMTVAPRLERLPVRPTRVIGITGAIAITGGAGRICAATARDVRCWDADRKPKSTPLAGVSALAVGNHTCAWRGGRDIACWGAAGYGQLGNGWSDARGVPTPVPGITDVVEIGTSYSPGTGESQWSCARRRDNKMWCWGNTSPHNTPGGDPAPHEMRQLGAIKHITRGMIAGAIDGKDRWVLAVTGGPTVHKLPPVTDAAGDCALATDGHVLCTFEHRASNDNLVGDGYPIPSIDDAVQVAVGGNPACVRRRGGQIVCFGTRTLDVIAAIPDAIDLGAGDFAACAVRANHHVWCWGQNGSWLLRGDPQHQNGDMPPIEIAGLADVAALSVGRDYACALAIDKTVWCWGENRSGQLGDGTVVARTQPARVPGLANVVQISAGTQHACALLADGTVTCWGESATGQIGTYATNAMAKPTAVIW